MCSRSKIPSFSAWKIALKKVSAVVRIFRVGQNDPSHVSIKSRSWLTPVERFICAFAQLPVMDNTFNFFERIQPRPSCFAGGLRDRRAGCYSWVSGRLAVEIETQNRSYIVMNRGGTARRCSRVIRNFVRSRAKRDFSTGSRGVLFIAASVA